MENIDRVAYASKANVFYPDEGLNTWETHIGLEARAPGTASCYMAIPLGEDKAIDPDCTIEMQHTLARLVRRNTKTSDLHMFDHIPHDAEDIGTQSYLTVLRRHRMRGAHAAALANAEFQDPQRPSECIKDYFDRLKRVAHQLRSLNRQVPDMAVVDAFKAGADTMHSSWLEDVDAEDTTVDGLEVLVLNKGCYREESAKKVARHDPPAALAASSTDISRQIAEGISLALAALQSTDTRDVPRRNNNMRKRGKHC